MIIRFYISSLCGTIKNLLLRNAKNSANGAVQDSELRN